MADSMLNEGLMRESGRGKPTERDIIDCDCRVSSTIRLMRSCTQKTDKHSDEKCVRCSILFLAGILL